MKNIMNDREPSPQEAVLRVVRRITELWLDKRYDDIGPLLADGVVIAPPGFDGRVHGREAYVQSYRDYDAAITTHEFAPGEPQIDIVDDTAVAVCPFFVVYEMEGAIYRENGRDVLVLARSGDAWRVIWRTMYTEPAQ